MIKRIKPFFPLVVAASFGLLISSIARNWQEISEVGLKLDSLNLLAIFILLLFGYLVNIISWHWLTKLLGADIPFLKNFKVWVFSSLTRFLPGKIWQYPARLLLLSDERMPGVLAGTAVLAEVLLNLSLGSLVVLLFLPLIKLPGVFENYRYIFIIFVFLPLIFLFSGNKKVIRYFALILSKLTSKKEVSVGTVKFSQEWIIPTVAAFSARFWLWGVVLFYLTNSLTSTNTSLIPFFVGAFSLSWLLGYIAPFAPAGLGVAEVSLALILSQVISFPLASFVAITFRILVLITEALFFFATLLFKNA